jgi:hypothetical protein
MWIYNETIIKTPRTMVIADVTYPRNIFRDSDLLTLLGIEPYEMPPQKNQRYWWNNELPRDVETLKEGMLNTINSQVSAIQGGIDWYWARASKGGKAVPTEIEEFAATIYAEQVTKEAEVTALTTLDDVMLYEATPYTEVRKIKHTSEDGVETYGPETDEHTRHINMTMHWTANPMDEIDPAFVSLTKV